MCFPDPGYPPGVLVSHDHWRAAPQSHRHGKGLTPVFAYWWLFTSLSVYLNSKSCLQPACLRSPLMFSLVNYTSAFLNSKSCLLPGSLRLSLMFSVVNGCLTWVIVARRSRPYTLKCNIMQLSFLNMQSRWLKGLQLMWVSSRLESLLLVNHQAVDIQKIPRHPRSSCFESVWASLRTNVFGNYSPLSLWQSELHHSLHCGPRNTAEEPEGS